MTFALKVSALSFLTLSALPLLTADELRLATGEVLRGVLEGTDEDYYYFRSPTFGLVQVARGDATYVDDADDSLSREVELSVVSSVPAGLELAAESNVEVRRPVKEPLPAAIDRVEPSADVNDPDRLWFYNVLDFLNPLKEWDSRIELSYAWKSAQTNSTDWRTSFRSTRKWDTAELRYFATYAYGTVETPTIDEPDGKEKETTTDEFETKLSYQHNWTKRFRWSVSGGYKYDQVLNIEHQGEGLLAVEWTLLKNTRFEFYLKPKAGARYRQTNLEEGEWQFITEMEQGMKFHWTPRTTLYEIGQFQWASESFQRSAYVFIVGMENKLSDVLGLHLRYKNSFDYQVDLGIDRGRQELTASLFYDF
jgi:hypothetical protein